MHARPVWFRAAIWVEVLVQGRAEDDSSDRTPSSSQQNVASSAAATSRRSVPKGVAAAAGVGRLSTDQPV